MKRIFTFLFAIPVLAQAQLSPDYIRHPTGVCSASKYLQYTATSGTPATCKQVDYSEITGTPPGTTYSADGSTLQLVGTTFSEKDAGTTNAKLANMAAHTLKANITGSSASPVDRSLSAILDAEIGSSNGMIILRSGGAWTSLASPSDGTKFLSGTNPLTFTIPALTYSPAYLFSTYSPTHGGWYDSSDLTTMFQDTGGTTPVTTVGQTIKLWKDKSGLGNDLSQGTTANAPVLGQDANGFYYVSFSGSQWMDTASTSAWDATTQLYVEAAAFSTAGVGTSVRIMDHRGTGAIPGTAGWYHRLDPSGTASSTVFDDGTHVIQFSSPVAGVDTYKHFTGARMNVTRAYYNYDGVGIENLATTAAMGSITSTKTCRIGAASNSSSTQNLTGGIYQLVMLNKFITWSDQQKMADYMSRSAGF